MSLDLDALRERLIESIHSDQSATDYFESQLTNAETILSLCAICAPYDKYSNDCRMQAAYFLSKAPAELLGEVIPLLCVLVTIPSADGEDMNRNIACHLLKAIERGRPHSKGTIYHDLTRIADEYGCAEPAG